MRVSHAPSMILKLAVAVPMASTDKDPLIAVSMVLPMLKMESSPAFCTVTETIDDLANIKIAQGYIPALYHCHKAMVYTVRKQPGGNKKLLKYIKANLKLHLHSRNADL